MELQVNCGFARVVIRKFSTLHKRQKFSHIDRKERANRFQQLFRGLDGIEDSLFESVNEKESRFDILCKRVNVLFNKWSNRDQRLGYLAEFSPAVWDKLPKIKQKRHTFAKCKECALTYKNAQQTFPGLKFIPGKSLAECASVLVEQNKASKSEQTSTKEILLELDTLYQATYGHSFTQVGGHYPCGACGAHVSRFDDFAHLSNFSWRGLQELQALVTKGTYSKILCICCSTILYTCSLQLLTNYSYRSSWERGRKC